MFAMQYKGIDLLIPNENNLDWIINLSLFTIYKNASSESLEGILASVNGDDSLHIAFLNPIILDAYDSLRIEGLQMSTNGNEISTIPINLKITDYDDEIDDITGNEIRIGQP